MIDLLQFLREKPLVLFRFQLSMISLHEGKRKHFTINLGNPVGAVYASGRTLTATITIVDDEFPTIEMTSNSNRKLMKMTLKETLK